MTTQTDQIVSIETVGKENYLNEPVVRERSFEEELDDDVYTTKIKGGE